MLTKLLISNVLSLFILLQATIVCAQPRTVPSAYSRTAPINYVQTWDVVKPITDAASITTASVLQDARMTTQYIDGLGRPLQTVVKSATPLGKDMVSAVEYDQFGREQFKYLPFAANSTGGNTSMSDGMFKLNPFQQQAEFYSNSSTSPIKGQGETYFYGQTQFEASPLNRVVKTLAPGNSWVGADKGVEMQYSVNTLAEDVRIWNVTSTVSAVPTSPAAYPTGELYKIITVDEKGKQVVEYKDKEGKVILKKVQLDNAPVISHSGWLSTYYVYDDLGNLRFVLQPKAVELIEGSWAISTTIKDELCFYYGYDARNRMVVKKVPGAAEVYMVYDKRDRLVLTQDGNLRGQNKWLFTKYDQLNRPIVTGFYADATHIGQASMQSYLDAQNMGLYENYQTATYPLYSLNQSFPFVNQSDVLTYTYYDDYTWVGWYGVAATKDNSCDSYFAAANNMDYPYPQALTQSMATKGMVTGVWEKTGAGLLTTQYYDYKGRVLQTRKYNITGGTDIVTTQYSFSGQVLQTIVKHEKLGTNPQAYYVNTLNSYDNAGRLLWVKKGVSSTGVVAATKTIVEQSYDELGQLKSKKLGTDPTNTSNPLETLTYDYNIRGWVLGANRDYAKSTASTSNYFGFDLGYDKQTIGTLGSYTGAELNGNIAGIVWKSTGDDQVRKYDFTYDNVNRLTAATFTQHNGGFNTSGGVDYSVSNLTYDANGNILAQKQKGWKLTGSDFIDQLSYTYSPSSNKLKNVIDASNDVNTKLGDF
ncbi:MAG TPA: DUF6443 domain-containing protein, partial [Chitinophagaceae bacterium]|nr:DUF6443 domain-containing protein [Chitinophagaceae bacterium]